MALLNRRGEDDPYGPLDAAPFAPPSPEDELAQIYGIDPNYQEPEIAPFEPTGYERFLEQFSTGLQGVQAPRPRNFLEGLLVGTATGLGNAGSRVAKARAQFEAKQQERNKQTDADRREATRRYREQVALRRLGEVKDTRTAQQRKEESDAEFARDNPPLTAEMQAAVPSLKRLPLGTPIPRSWMKPEEPKAAPPYREERLPVTPELLKEFPQFRGLTTIGADDLIKARTPSTTKLKAPNSAERDALTTDVGLLKQVSEIRSKFDKSFVGPVASKFGSAQQRTGLFKREGESKFRAAIAGMRNQILKARSGGAVSDGEAARLLEELPTMDDPSEVFQDKLDVFEATLRNIAETRREIFSETGVDVGKLSDLPQSAGWGGPSPAPTKPKRGGWFEANSPVVP